MRSIRWRSTGEVGDRSHERSTPALSFWLVLGMSMGFSDISTTLLVKEEVRRKARVDRERAAMAVVSWHVYSIVRVAWPIEKNHGEGARQPIRRPQERDLESTTPCYAWAKLTTAPRSQETPYRLSATVPSWNR